MTKRPEAMKITRQEAAAIYSLSDRLNDMAMPGLDAFVIANLLDAIGKFFTTGEGGVKL